MRVIIPVRTALTNRALDKIQYGIVGYRYTWDALIRGVAVEGVLLVEHGEHPSEHILVSCVFEDTGTVLIQNGNAAVEVADF